MVYHPSASDGKNCAPRGWKRQRERDGDPPRDAERGPHPASGSEEKNARGYEPTQTSRLTDSKTDYKTWDENSFVQGMAKCRHPVGNAAKEGGFGLLTAAGWPGSTSRAAFRQFLACLQVREVEIRGSDL